MLLEHSSVFVVIIIIRIINVSVVFFQTKRALVLPLFTLFPDAGTVALHGRRNCESAKKKSRGDCYPIGQWTVQEDGPKRTWLPDRAHCSSGFGPVWLDSFPPGAQNSGREEKCKRGVFLDHVLSFFLFEIWDLGFEIGRDGFLSPRGRVMFAYKMDKISYLHL